MSTAAPEPQTAQTVQTAQTNQVRFWPLLVMMCASLMIFPMAFQLFGAGGRLYVNMAIWCAGIYAISRRRRMLIFSVICTVTIISSQAALIENSDACWLMLVFHIAVIAFIASLGVFLLIEVFRSTKVTGDTILGSICGYLVLGILFAALYSLSEELYPNSFNMPDHLGSSQDLMTWVRHEPGADSLDVDEYNESLLMYFSFTTLTTLGYGDISPRSNMARALSSLEAVLGQLYLAVLVARLVSVADSPRRRYG
jgi:hypothetical protein